MSFRFLLMCGLIGAVLATEGCKSRGPRPIPVQEPTSAESRRQAQDYALRAQRKAQAGNSEEAIELYRKAIEHDREMAQAWNNIGVLLMQAERYPDAITAFNEAASLSMGDPRPVSNIGQVWLRLGYARDALTNFEDALRREPTDIPSLRGAIRAAHLLDIADERTSDWIKTAIYHETDPDWLEYFTNQRTRVDGRLEDARRASRP